MYIYVCIICFWFHLLVKDLLDAGRKKNPLMNGFVEVLENHVHNLEETGLLCDYCALEKQCKLTTGVLEMVRNAEWQSDAQWAPNFGQVHSGECNFILVSAQVTGGNTFVHLVRVPWPTVITAISAVIGLVLWSVRCLSKVQKSYWELESWPKLCSCPKVPSSYGAW